MIRLPPFGRGQRIGLFGGSFNPAHKGHVMVALYALKRLQLDWVWWLVSPQNPLKDAKDTGRYDNRLSYARKLARHPRFVVTDIERQMKSRYSADTIEQLQRHGRHARFVWIMGADSLRDLHHWHHWQDIANEVALAVLARPGYSVRALSSKAAVRLARARASSDRPSAVLTQRPPGWVFITMPLRPESSTAIRKRRNRTP
jgi:nicotinate-nucleotide adenylyltransferase